MTCGFDGSIYDWNIKEMRKENDHTDKKYQYHACVANDKPVWVVGAHTQEVRDNKKPIRMREMDLSSQHAEAGVSDYECTESAPTCLALGEQHRMLLAGCDDGCVRVYAFPMQGGINESIMAHCGSVARICLTYEESMLFTIGDDGVLFIYDVKEKETKQSKREITFSEEILISTSELEEKNLTIQTLKAKAEELKVDMDFQDKRRHIKHDEKKRDLSDVFRVDSLKQAQEFEKLWNAHLDQEKNFTEIKRDTIEKHKSESGKFEQDFLSQLRQLDQKIAAGKSRYESNKIEFANRLRRTGSSSRSDV